MIAFQARPAVATAIDVRLVAVLLRVVASRAYARAAGRVTGIVRGRALTVVDALDARPDAVTDAGRAWVKGERIRGDAVAIDARDRLALRGSGTGALARSRALGPTALATGSTGRRLSSSSTIAAALGGAAIASIASIASVAAVAPRAVTAAAGRRDAAGDTAPLLGHEHPRLDADDPIAAGAREPHPEDDERSRPLEARRSSHLGPLLGKTRARAHRPKKRAFRAEITVSTATVQREPAVAPPAVDRTFECLDRSNRLW